MTRWPVYVYAPKQPAPASAAYEQVNISGSPTGIRVNVVQGHPLPAEPVGHGWAAVEGDVGDC
jgi:hypothetical protein